MKKRDRFLSFLLLFLLSLHSSIGLLAHTGAAHAITASKERIKHPERSDAKAGRKVVGEPRQAAGTPERTAQSTAVNFAEPAALARAQTGVTGNQDEAAPQEVSQAFVIYEAPNGDSVCRVATPDEAQEFTRDRGVTLRQINHLEDQDLDPSQSANPDSTPNATAGITINLRGTAQLDANPAAKQAFINAAAKWEAIITDPITVTLDVDFGTTAFGNSFPSSTTLAQTSSTLYSYSYSTVRSQLIRDAPVGSAEATLLNSLPASSLPADIGSISTVFALPSIISALNLPPPPSIVTVPRIGFNSAFGFDFDPNDGVPFNLTDFDAVAVHEIGHALGFTSEAGQRELDPNRPLAMTIWDFYRFRQGAASNANFSTATRALASGLGITDRRFQFNGNAEVELSSGKPDATGGDGRQSSHWKDDDLNGGNYIGIMDPTLSKGIHKTITANDIRAIEFFGYSTVQNTACTYSISPPSNSVGAGSTTGSVTVTTASNCAWTATSNSTFITITAGGSGTGNGTVNYSVAANTTSSARTGTLTIAGQTFTLTQAAGACPPAAISAGQNVSGSLAATDCRATFKSGSFTDRYTFSGTAGQQVAISMSSTLFDTYIYLLAPNGTVAAENDDGALGTDSRIPATSGFFSLPTTGTYIIEATSFASNNTGSYTLSLLTQTPCNYSITPTSNSIGTGATTGSVAVSVATGCAWTATSNSSFITITSGASGAGNGTVGYSVAANTGAARTGTLTVAGRTFTVTQAGASCTYTISPTSQSFTATASSGSVSVTSGAGCNWTATSNSSFITITGGNSGAGNGTVSYSVAANTTSGARTGTLTIAGQTFTATQAAGGTTPPAVAVQFSSAAYSFNESSTSAVITVTRTGSTAGSVSAVYFTLDNLASVRCDVANGTAYARCDYATTVDTITFAPGEASKTFTIPLVNDVHVEGPETVQLRLANPVGGTLGAQSSATLTIADNDAGVQSNPILQSPFFVRLQYLDFLSREPDTAGFNAWLGLLNDCPNVNNNPSCDRLVVSQSFFASQEFQLKGYFVYRFYRVAFGRLPQYTEIVTDMRNVTGQTSQEVFAKKAAFATAYAQRAEFGTAFGALSNTAFVSALLNRYSLTSIRTPDPATPDGTAKVTLTGADLVARLNAGTLTRAQALRAVADSDQVFATEYNPAFVAMQYFGYLRRDPEAQGLTNWLNYLNANPTDFRTMVNGFMNSTEYRLRFGQP